MASKTTKLRVAAYFCTQAKAGLVKSTADIPQELLPKQGTDSRALLEEQGFAEAVAAAKAKILSWHKLSSQEAERRFAEACLNPLITGTTEANPFREAAKRFEAEQRAEAEAAAKAEAEAEAAAKAEAEAAEQRKQQRKQQRKRSGSK